MAGYIVGFGEGAAAHVRDLAVGGLHVYTGAPVPIQVLWQSLVVLNPLAVVLIVTARPVGPLVGAAIMLGDVFCNWWTNWDHVLRDPAAYLQPVGLLPITLFGIFVVATALPLRRVFWLDASRRDAATSPEPRPV